MLTLDIKKEYNGKPIEQNFSHPALGLPSLLVQHAFPSHFQIHAYFDESLAYTGEFCTAIFRIYPKNITK